MLAMGLLLMALAPRPEIITDKSVVHLPDGLTVSCFVTDLIAKKTWYGDGTPAADFIDPIGRFFGGGLHRRPTKCLVLRVESGRDRRANALVMKLMGGGGNWFADRSGEPRLHTTFGMSSENCKHMTKFDLVTDLFKDPRQTDDFIFGYTTESWKTVAVYQASGDSIAPQGLIQYIRDNHFSTFPKEDDHYVELGLKFSANVNLTDVRFLAFDRAGREFQSYACVPDAPDLDSFDSNYYTVGPDVALPTHGPQRVGLSTKSLEKIEVQTRSLNWIEFRGVHLAQ